MTHAISAKRSSSDPTEALFAATRALCNVCGRLTDAKIVLTAGRVHLVKWCPEHGFTRTLVCDDEAWFRRSLGFVKPGTDPKRRAIAHATECPGGCGLCPAHMQHTCVPILEVISDCDLHCPICLVDGAGVPCMTVDEVQRTIDGILEVEGRLNMLTISGGEPTIHPEFRAIVDACLRAEVGLVSVSTNGLTLADDESLVRFLAERGVVVSLQFDGVRPETYRCLRGNPRLAEEKRELIERILALQGRLSLTMTLARNVNEDEIPEVLSVFFSDERILSLMVQPLVDTSWRSGASPRDVLDRVTLSEVVRRLVCGSGGRLTGPDFSPLPCSHPSCFALTYLLNLSDGRTVSLPSILDAESYLEITKNQALLNTDADTLLRIKDALYSIWTASGSVPDRKVILAALRRVLLEINALGPAASHRDVLTVGMRNVKSIFIHEFMDRFSFDLSRVVKCCNHYPQPDGRLIPACIRNNLGVPVSSAKQGNLRCQTCTQPR